MAIERTLAMVKPDAVAKGVVGEAIRVAEEAGLTPIAMRRFQMTKEQAGGFYAVHRERPFFDELTTFMSSGPIVAIVFEGENAIAKWRELLGDTNPADAPEGTLRKRFGTDIGHNGFHGSDATDTSNFECHYHFRGIDLL